MVVWSRCYRPHVQLKTIMSLSQCVCINNLLSHEDLREKIKRNQHQHAEFECKWFVWICHVQRYQAASATSRWFFFFWCLFRSIPHFGSFFREAFFVYLREGNFTSNIETQLNVQIFALPSSSPLQTLALCIN